MAMFQFRLATLLKLREAARDERRAHLAQAYQADALLEGEQQRIREALGGLQVDYRRACSPGEINADRLLESLRHELLLKAHQQHLQSQRELIAQEIERRRIALAEANREVKVLENLRQRQYEHYQDEENWREIRRLDEVAQQQALREERA